MPTGVDRAHGVGALDTVDVVVAGVGAAGQGVAPACRCGAPRVDQETGFERVEHGRAGRDAGCVHTFGDVVDRPVQWDFGVPEDAVAAGQQQGVAIEADVWAQRCADACLGIDHAGPWRG